MIFVSGITNSGKYYTRTLYDLFLSLKLTALKAHSSTLAQTCFEILKITGPQILK